MELARDIRAHWQMKIGKYGGPEMCTREEGSSIKPAGMKNTVVKRYLKVDMCFVV